MGTEVRRKDLIYPELSYTINGVLFEVFKKLGFGYQEKLYQRAVAKTFRERGIRHSEQYAVPILLDETKIGTYYFDFLVEDLIALEIKQGNYFKRTNLDQVVGYLKSKNIKLGLLANFTSYGVKIYRVLNV